MRPLGHGGGSVVAGFHWTGEAHPYGQPVPLYACVSPLQGRSVEIAPVPAGVTVTPARQPVDPGGGGVELFELVVQRGATGRVWLRQLNDAGVATVITGGPQVVTGPDGWHFAADK